MPIQVQPFNFGADIRNQNRQDRAINLRELALGQQMRNTERRLSNQERQLDIAAQRMGLTREQLGIRILQESVANASNAEEAIQLAETYSQTPLPEPVKQQLRSLPAETFVKPESFGQALAKGQDAQGNDVFLQAGSGGTVRAVEGFTPPGPTPEEQALAAARAQKAEADAAAAEKKGQEAEKAETRAQQAKQDAAALAAELLQGDLDAIFGSVFGMEEPILRQASVDLDVIRTRLVNLLTVDNLELMSGVLSESDIKILAGAATALSDRRMSDGAARAEIKRVYKALTGEEYTGPEFGQEAETITEEDIQATMKANDMTREQVEAKLREQGRM